MLPICIEVWLAVVNFARGVIPCTVFWSCSSGQRLGLSTFYGLISIFYLVYLCLFLLQLGNGRRPTLLFLHTKSHSVVSLEISLSILQQWKFKSPRVAVKIFPCFYSLNSGANLINPLKPNDPYRGRTAPLTSKLFILYIYSTNIGTEYFKHGIYSPFFSSSKCSLFHNSNIFDSCIIHILYTGVLKFKKK